MHLAARDGSKEVLQFLITNGFDKDVRTPVRYYTIKLDSKWVILSSLPLCGTDSELLNSSVKLFKL